MQVLSAIINEIRIDIGINIQKLNGRSKSRCDQCGSKKQKAREGKRVKIEVGN